jgi:hypothetical protein
LGDGGGLAAHGRELDPYAALPLRVTAVLWLRKGVHWVDEALSVRVAEKGDVCGQAVRREFRPRVRVGRLGDEGASAAHGERVGAGDVTSMVIGRSSVLPHLEVKLPIRRPGVSVVP